MKLVKENAFETFLLLGLLSLFVSKNSFGQAVAYNDPICVGATLNLSGLQVYTGPRPVSYRWDGSNLTNNLVITASAGHEVSTSSRCGLGLTETPTPSYGTWAFTNKWIRLSVSAVNGAIGNVVTGLGTIIPNNTDGTASSTPTLCKNTTLSNGKKKTTGAIGISTARGLPSRLSASWSYNITIRCPSITNGTFTYSIRLMDCCGNVNANGTIILTPANTVGTPSSTPRIFINTGLTPISYAIADATGIVSSSGFPTSISAFWAANTIANIGTPTTLGVFNDSISLRGGYGSVVLNGTAIASAQSILTGNDTIGFTRTLPFIITMLQSIPNPQFNFIS